MRLDLSMLFASLAALSVADTIETELHCKKFLGGRRYGCRSRGELISDYGIRYEIDVDDGCRGKSAPVPDMVELCLDWGKGSAWFKFEHQSNKRCMIHRWCGIRNCDRTRWEEVPCNVANKETR